MCAFLVFLVVRAPSTQRRASRSTVAGPARCLLFGTDQRSLLTVTANYVGMMLVFLLPVARGRGPGEVDDVDGKASLRGSGGAPATGTTTTLQPSDQRAVLGISALDLAGMVCTTLAIFFVGSGVRESRR